MNYNLSEIEKVEAFKLHGYKTDVQVQIIICLNKHTYKENISVKLVKNTKGFNQVDKRWVNAYAEMWDIPEDLELILKKYTGEVKCHVKGLKDPRRMFFNEMLSEDVDKVIKFFVSKKDSIVSDLIKGKDFYTPDWMLVTLKLDSEVKWALKPINEVIKSFSSGDVCLTKHGNLKIGKITMQRKGGDGGKLSANMLQFKINPVILFDEKL